MGAEEVEAIKGQVESLRRQVEALHDERLELLRRLQAVAENMGAVRQVLSRLEAAGPLPEALKAQIESDTAEAARALARIAMAVSQPMPTRVTPA